MTEEFKDLANDIEQELQDERVELTPEEVLTLVKEDWEVAKKAKVDIEKKMQKWKDLYEGKPLGNETDGRSKIVMNEARKAVNWWIPNSMKPFMTSNDIAEFIPRTYDDVEKAKSQNVLINYQFNNDFPKYKFLYDTLQVFASEGTVVARTGWLHEEELEPMPFEGITDEQLAQLAQQGAAEIDVQETVEVPVENPVLGGVESVDRIHRGVAYVKKVTKSRPDAELIKNEDFWIIGETIEDSDACIQRIDTNMSELRQNPAYENVDDIVIPGSADPKEAGLGQARQTDLEEYGTPDENIKRTNGREDVTIYEYYGKIDINGDGIAEDIVCVWCGNVILKLGENPFPDKKPPFIGTPFMPMAFSFWGNALPHYVEDITKIKSAMVRTAIDLMATSTNGLKNVQKGSIDALNMRRLKEAKIGTVVEWNDINGLRDQKVPEIPSTLMPMMEFFTAEGENESGITRYNQGLDAKSLNKTATGISAIMNQSQMRTWETVTRFAEGFMKPLFRKWMAYNQEFLDTNIAVRVVGEDYTEISPDDIAGEFDLSINVAVAGSEEMKSQKIVGMLQMVTPLVQQGVLPPDHITKLIGELEELSGFKELAQELKQIARQKQEAANEAQQAFLSLPPEAQMQIMQMAQQQMQAQQEGAANQPQ